MRIGAHVFNYADGADWAKIHADLGYGAAYWPLPLDVGEKKEKEFLEAAKAYHLVISEIGAWNNLLERNLEKREQNIQYTIQALRLADRVGAKCCINITGSWADTWDGPDPENLTEKTFDEVVKIIQRIIDTAMPERTFYTVEPMPWLYPNSIESMELLLEAVNRKQFAVHADMCNLINSFDKVYHTGEYTMEFFKKFGKKIKAVHAKDINVGKTLTLQIHETIPGEGIFDLDTLLLECEQIDPDLPIMTEHLNSEEEYRKASGDLLARAKRLGITLYSAYI